MPGQTCHGETCCLDEDRVDVGADWPLGSMVRESYDCIAVTQLDGDPVPDCPMLVTPSGDTSTLQACR